MVTDPDDILEALGRRIAELRRGKGLTQEQLAESLEVTPRYVQAIEAGTENLSVRSLCKLADTFAVTVGALFDEPKERTVRKGRPPKPDD